MKLNRSQNGHFHIALLALAVATVIGFTGAYVATRSKHGGLANIDVQSAAASISDSCGRSKTLVEALPTDFLRTSTQVRAEAGHGLFCVNNKSIGARVATTSPRPGKTIVMKYHCSGSDFVAYDKNNPDGTDYTGDGRHWFVQTYNGADTSAKKSLYCIPSAKLNKRINGNGENVGTLFFHNCTHLTSGCHNYKFIPLYGIGKACSSTADPVRYQHTACSRNWYFSTYNDLGGDVDNPEN